jgi:hypothetical protein
VSRSDANRAAVMLSDFQSLHSVVALLPTVHHCNHCNH